MINITSVNDVHIQILYLFKEALFPSKMSEQIVDDTIQKAHIRRMTNIACGAVKYKTEQPLCPKIKSHPFDTGIAPNNGWSGKFSTEELYKLEHGYSDRENEVQKWLLSRHTK